MEYFSTTSAASRRASSCIIVGVYERGKLGAAAADIAALQLALEATLNTTARILQPSLLDFLR